jgi:hypothetical protein
MAMLMAATRRKSSTYLDTPRRQELDKSVEEFLPPLDFLQSNEMCFRGGFTNICRAIDRTEAQLK